MRALYLFLLSIALSFASTSHAAFPVNAQTAPASADIASKDIIKSTLQELKQNIQYSARQKERSHNANRGEWQGIASIATGAVGTVALAAGIFTGAGILLPLGIILSILAIVFGAMGFKTENRSLAIAGFVLGIVNIGLIILGVIVSLLFLFFLFK